MGLRIGLYTARSHIRDTGEKRSTVENKLKIEDDKSALVALFLRKSSLCHAYANSLNFQESAGGFSTSENKSRM